MYERGDIYLSEPYIVPEQCACGHTKEVHDEGGDCLSNFCYGEIWQCREYRPSPAYIQHKGIAENVSIDTPVAYLPHSCDEWVIGGREQIEALIADLQKVLDKQIGEK